MTICDSFEDFKNYPHKENLNKLMIGSESTTAKKSSVDLRTVLDFGYYYKLTDLYVINAIDNLELESGDSCSYTNLPLEYVTFYGNLFKTIEKYHFPVYAVKKFNLVNNNIEAIKSWAFADHHIENMDLSDNLMEDIEAGALPQTSVTKTIIIKNNKLTHIEVGSFPSSLEVLNLGWNKFRHIQDEIFENLLKLKELTLSHNNFKEIPRVNSLTQLVIFDMSFNAISTVSEGVFKDMKRLKFLDLSNNNIESPLLIQRLQIPVNQEITISLALNRLMKLDLTNVSLDEKTLVLYGNPWHCHLWTSLKTELSGHESQCDLKLSSRGNIPYCVSFRYNIYTMEYESKNEIDRFHQVVRSSMKNFECDLALPRNEWLSNVHYMVSCVA
ncbi:carboxypeptidase N subunit 2 [Tribolium castaneum]|uniref:Leucine-rich repeat-containing protein 15-like Protein n=1 Tax=Tribolium castaneum TaxID=7070 RepID=D2A3A3_TRICA|nr:Leucine-rich repeat-containing protein 15-like Protein [Tribolium castaneum]